MQEIRNTPGQYSYDAGKLTARYIIIIAIAISVLWHVMMLFTFRVFVGNAGAPRPDAYSRISFVGSILEDRPMISADAAERSSESARLRNMAGVSLQASGGYKAGGNSKMAPASEIDLLKEIRGKGPEPAGGEKKIPEKPFDKVMVSYKTYASEVEGPARFREVIYKPEFPSYLRWDESLGVDLQGLGDSFEIGLKFWVSDEGKVESVERVSSSGHPTVDIVAMRYLKGWQFAPYRAGDEHERQWGALKLRLKLEKAAGR